MTTTAIIIWLVHAGYKAAADIYVAVNIKRASACMPFYNLYRAYHGIPCSSTVVGRPSDRMSLCGD